MSGQRSARLRVGIIGLGIGRSHIEGWRQHPQVDVVAIADADAQRLDQVGDQYDIATRYTSAETMLAVERARCRQHLHAEQVPQGDWRSPRSRPAATCCARSRWR